MLAKAHLSPLLHGLGILHTLMWQSLNLCDGLLASNLQLGQPFVLSTDVDADASAALPPPLSAVTVALLWARDGLDARDDVERASSSRALDGSVAVLADVVPFLFLLLHSSTVWP